MNQLSDWEPGQIITAVWFSLHSAGEWGSDGASAFTSLTEPTGIQDPALLQGFSLLPTAASSTITSSFPFRYREVCIRERQPFSMDFYHLAMTMDKAAYWCCLYFWYTFYFGSCRAKGTKAKKRNGIDCTLSFRVTNIIPTSQITRSPVRQCPLTVPEGHYSQGNAKVGWICLRNGALKKENSTFIEV